MRLATTALLTALAGCATRPRTAALSAPAPLTLRPQPDLVVAAVTVEDFRWREALPGWGNAADAIVAASAGWLGVPEERLLRARNPDLEQFRQLIDRRLPAMVDADDTLLFYLGTHRNEDGRTLLHGGDSLAAGELARLLQRLPGRRVVFLGDFCYAADIERFGALDARLARLYAASAADRAPDLPLDGKLPSVRRFFAETQARLSSELGLMPRDRYALLGLMFVHSLAMELARRPADLALADIVERMDHERALLAPLVATGRLPEFESVNIADVRFAPAAPPPRLTTAGAPPPPNVIGRTLLKTSGSPPMPATLEALLKGAPTSFDLGRANLLLGSQLDPDLEVEEVDRQVEQMANDLRARLADERDPRKVIAGINRYLYEDLAFKARIEPYARDFLLHELLNTRHGRCAGLVSLYLSLGHRLGLPLRSVCIPEHIFVRWVRQADSRWDWPEDAEYINIETTLGGVRLTDERYREMHPWRDDAPAAAFYLRPLTDRETLGALHSALGSALLGQERYGAARDACRFAVETNPLDVEAWNNLGNVLRRQGLTDDARRAYEQAVELLPTFAAAWNNLGIVQEKPAKRVEVLKQAVSLKPDLVEAWQNLAYAHFENDSYQLAWACARRCHDLGKPLPEGFVEQLRRKLIGSRRVP